jgi:hypothetical protein
MLTKRPVIDQWVVEIWTFRQGKRGVNPFKEKLMIIINPGHRSEDFSAS